MTPLSKIQETLSNSIDNEPLIKQAINEIFELYGDVVSVDEKKKSLLKFGRNELVGTSAATVMTLPAGINHETYVGSDLITTFSSSNASDTEDIVIEGHTLDAGNFTFVSQPGTINGQNQVAMTTPLARVSRAYNSNGVDLLGAIYFYENDTDTSGVPDTDAKVHMIIPAGSNQTRKASTTLSSTDYWIVTASKASALEKSASFANIEIQTRAYGKVFRSFDTYSTASAAGTQPIEYKPYKIIPKNADMRMVADADGAGTDISGSVSGFLASIAS